MGDADGRYKKEKKKRKNIEEESNKSSVYIVSKWKKGAPNKKNK